MSTREVIATVACVVAFALPSRAHAATEGIEPRTTTSPVAASAADQDVFHAVTPTRLLDTRSGVGQPAPGPVRGGTSISLTVAGRGPIPSTGVTAVVLNVTGIASGSNTFVTVWPTGVPRPLASSLNLRPREVRPNLVEVAVSPSGRVSLFNQAGNVHLIADVAGWVGPSVPASAGGEQRATAPARILDTRDGTGAPAPGKLPAGSTLDLQVTGRGGVPATGVSAVVLNVTATGPTASAFVTASPSGSARPLASNLNVVAGRTIANRVIVKVGAGGRVALYHDSGALDLVVDVGGWFTEDTGPDVVGAGFRALTPTRFVDTRTGTGAPDAQVGPKGTITVKVAGIGGIPAASADVPATSVVANITATGASKTSYLTAWPSGSSRPLASDLNFVAGETAPNLAIVQLGPDGAFSVYNAAGNVDVIVDVLGWYEGDVQLQPDALALTKAEAAAVSSVSPSGLSFATKPGRLATLQVGDVLVAGASAAAPTGFLREITALQASGGGWTVTTASASLDDVLLQGALSTGVPLQPLEPPAPIAPRLASAAQPAGGISVGGELSFPFNHAVSGGGGGGTVTLSGSAAVAAGAELDVEVGFLGVKRARFASTASQRFSADLTAQYSGNWSVGPIELGSYTFAPITFTIGPVPVVIQPELSATLNASGSVEASLHASVDQGESITTSLTYEDGTVVPDTERTTTAPTFSGPVVDGLAQARVSVDPKVSLVFYGVADVGVTLSAYLRVQADLCHGELFAGLELAASFSLSILGHDLIDYSTGSATVGEKRLAEVMLGGCWTGTARFQATMTLSSDTYQEDRASDMTWTILGPVENKPNHYLVRVTGTYSESRAETWPGPPPCSTTSSVSGSTDTTLEMLIFPDGAGWSVELNYDGWLGNAYGTGYRSCEDQHFDAYSSFFPTFICTAFFYFTDDTVSLDQFDGTLDLSTEQCPRQTLTWSFHRE